MCHAEWHDEISRVQLHPIWEMNHPFTQCIHLSELWIHPGFPPKGFGKSCWGKVIGPSLRWGEELEIDIEGCQMAGTWGSELPGKRETVEKWTQRSICNFPLRHLPTPKLGETPKNPAKTKTNTEVEKAIKMGRNFSSPIMPGRQRLQFKPARRKNSGKHSKFSVETLHAQSQE